MPPGHEDVLGWGEVKLQVHPPISPLERDPASGKLRAVPAKRLAAQTHQVISEAVASRAASHDYSIVETLHHEKQSKSQRPLKS